MTSFEIREHNRRSWRYSAVFVIFASLFLGVFVHFENKREQKREQLLSGIGQNASHSEDLRLLPYYGPAEQRQSSEWIELIQGISSDLERKYESAPLMIGQTFAFTYKYHPRVGSVNVNVDFRDEANSRGEYIFDVYASPKLESRFSDKLSKNLTDFAELKVGFDVAMACAERGKICRREAFHDE